MDDSGRYSLVFTKRNFDDSCSPEEPYDHHEDGSLRESAEMQEESQKCLHSNAGKQTVFFHFFFFFMP